MGGWVGGQKCVWEEGGHQEVQGWGGCAQVGCDGVVGCGNWWRQLEGKPLLAMRDCSCCGGGGRGASCQHDCHCQ